MKIAVYDPYLDTLGGGEKYMMTAAQVLSEHHNVAILWDNADDIERVEDRFNVDLSKTQIHKNIFSKNVSFVKRLKLSSQYDAILYLSDGSIPVVSSKLFIHFQFPIEWVQLSWKDTLKLKRVAKIICNSKFTAKYIDKKLGVKSTIIYPPVSIFKEQMKKVNIVLHVGRFMKTGVEGQDYKKQYFMIESFKKLVDEGVRDWKFVMAVSVKSADLADFRKMQEKAAGYPISFIINATNQELWKEYARAKIYWHASGFGEDVEKHPERAEHFGISTVEAMSAGVVPVVINLGGQKEIVSHESNGLLWDTQDELLTYTRKLMDGENRLENLATQAQKDSKKYSYEVFRKEFQAII